MRQMIVRPMVLVLVSSFAAAATAQETAEELPPPATKSVLAKPTPAAKPESIMRDSAATAWGLYGVSGRHYFTDQLAIADYVRDGRRFVAALAQEDPSSHAQVDLNFHYYREQEAGHRWAISRRPGGDRSYSVYFQAAEAPGAWKLFQHARATWDESTVFEPAGTLVVVEPSCGN